MRRVTLTVFFFLAACGGAVSTPSTGAIDPSSGAAAAQAVILSAGGQEVIASFANAFGQSEIDICLEAYVDDFAGPSGLNEPVSKPDVKGLRTFLAQCLGGPAPGDQRTSGTTDHVRAEPSNQ